MTVGFTIYQRSTPDSRFGRSFLQDKITFGRVPSADICLPDMSVSTRHAEIRFKSPDYVLTDLDSLNGTHVNDVRLVPHRGRKLKDGDIIGIGTFQVVFKAGGTKGGIEPRDASSRQAKDMLASILSHMGAAPESCDIVVIEGPDQGLRIPLSELPQPFRLGRGAEAEVRLTDPDVSRIHAEAFFDGPHLILQDANSHNGLFWENQQVEQAILGVKSPLRMGQTVLRLEQSLDKSLAQILEAPEDATASYVFDVESVILQPHPVPTDNPAMAKDSRPPVMAEDPLPEEPLPPPEPPKPLDIGPADPLVSEDPATPRWTTTSIPLPAPKDRSDITLVLLGIMIVSIAVLGLLYFFLRNSP